MGEGFVTTTIDGVRAFIRPKDGPASMGLVFRVGVADEQVANRGITHLVEHLALFGVMDADAHVNGYTALATTGFVVRGRGEETVAFFAEVCRALGSLPRERFDIERRILEAEARERAGGLLDRHLRHRYGNQRWGLIDHGEHGLHRLGFAEVQAWADHHFTRENAVFWAVGQVPADLTLRLPSGAPRPAPPVAATVTGRRGFAGDGAVVASMEVPSGPVASLAAVILGERCLQRLRMREGQVYSVHPSLTDLDGHRALLALAVDTSPEHATAIVDGVLSELGVLSVVGPEPDDVERAQRLARRSLDDPDAHDGAAQAAAVDTLLGVRPRTVEERAADLAGVTRRQLRDLFEQSTASLHVTVPRAAHLADHRYLPNGLRIAPPPGGSARTVVVDQADRLDRLAVDDWGVSEYEHGAGLARVIPWSEVSGVLRHPNGVRVVFGSDDAAVVVVADEWRDGAAGVGTIDLLAPRHVVVDVAEPARTPYLDAARATPQSGPRR